MTKALLIDTGPLIALVSKNDKYHRICSETHRTIDVPLWTCWPVLTEATYMLRRLPDATARLFAAFTEKAFVLRPLDDAAVVWISQFMHKYANIEASLADAALVYLAERENIRRVFTLDRDFLSEGGQARTVSAVDAEPVGGAEVLLLQRLASASRAVLAAQSVRAVHRSWHRQ